MSAVLLFARNLSNRQVKGNAGAHPSRSRLIFNGRVRIITLVKQPVDHPTADRAVPRSFTLPVLLTGLLAALLAGCGGSGESSVRTDSTPPPAVRPAQDSAPVPDLPRGKFTVQIGAFRAGPSAEEMAGIARSRFTRNVYTIFDETDGLFRVMLGVFDTKDLAREFRDLIVRQYPDDYKDAWVSQLER